MAAEYPEEFRLYIRNCRKEVVSVTH